MMQVFELESSALAVVRNRTQGCYSTMFSVVPTHKGLICNVKVPGRKESMLKTPMTLEPRRHQCHTFAEFSLSFSLRNQVRKFLKNRM